MKNDTFMEEVKQAVEDKSNCSANRITIEEEEELDEFLLNEDLEDPEEKDNSHFSRSVR